MDLKEGKHRDQKIKSTRHPWEEAKVEVVSTLIKENVKNTNTKNIVFDVGCGDSFVTEKLLEKFPSYEFYAIDTAFDNKTLNYYNNKYKGKALQLFKTIDDASAMIKDEISLVLLFDVIEHIDNDVNFLQKLSNNKNITNNTLFFITVPAFQSLFCSHDKFLEHYRRYNKKLLEETISKAGFKEITSGYFFFTLVFVRLLQVIKEKLMPQKKESTGLVEWKGGNFKKKFFKFFLITDFKIMRLLSKIGLNFFGLSTYTICKKSV